MLRAFCFSYSILNDVFKISRKMYRLLTLYVRCRTRLDRLIITPRFYSNIVFHKHVSAIYQNVPFINYRRPVLIE